MADAEARLDHSEVLRKLAMNKAQENEEQARSVEKWAKIAEDQAKASKSGQSH